MQFVRRKWGFYITLIDRAKFKVKILRFEQFGKLSKQWHKYRNELWLFLNGQGKLIINDDIAMNDDMSYNGRYFLIKRGDVHEFIAWKSTWIIEIQFGDKCVEEDIVRL